MSTRKEQAKEIILRHFKPSPWGGTWRLNPSAAVDDLEQAGLLSTTTTDADTVEQAERIILSKMPRRAHPECAFEAARALAEAGMLTTPTMEAP